MTAPQHVVALLVIVQVDDADRGASAVAAARSQMRSLPNVLSVDVLDWDCGGAWLDEYGLAKALDDAHRKLDA